MTPRSSRSEYERLRDRATRSGDGLARVEAAVEARDFMQKYSEEVLDEAIREAHAQGYSYTDISKVMGISRQAVQKRMAVLGERGRR